jgi:hypothetical protein
MTAWTRRRSLAAGGALILLTNAIALSASLPEPGR